MKSSHTPEVNKYAILIFHRRLWWFPSVRWHRLTMWTDCTDRPTSKACGGGSSTHLLSWPGPCRGGGATPVTWNSSVDTLMWILKLKVFMNETPLVRTRPPPSQRRTTWRRREAELSDWRVSPDQRSSTEGPRPLGGPRRYCRGVVKFLID